MADIRAPDSLKRLVETFDRNLDTYRTPAYNEMQLRRDFIDPFFLMCGEAVSSRCL